MSQRTLRKALRKFFVEIFFSYGPSIADVRLLPICLLKRKVIYFLIRHNHKYSLDFI